MITPIQTPIEKLNEKLRDAVARNNFIKIDQTLSEGADINYVDSRSNGGLLFSVYKVKTAKYLIQKGLNIKLKSAFFDAEGDTPLTKRCQIALMSVKSKKDTEEFKALIDYFIEIGIPVNGHGNIGGSALYYAAGFGNTEIVKFLIQKGSNVNECSEYYGGPLHNACDSEESNLEVVRILVDNGADVNLMNKYEMETPIFRAVSSGKTEVVKYLIEKGAILDIKNQYNKTIFSYAKNLEIFEALFVDEKFKKDYSERLIKAKEILKELDHLNYFKYVKKSNLKRIENQVLINYLRNLSISSDYSEDGFSYDKRFYMIDAEDIAEGIFLDRFGNLEDVLEAEGIEVEDYDLEYKGNSFYLVFNDKKFIIYDEENEMESWTQGAFNLIVALNKLYKSVSSEARAYGYLFGDNDNHIVILTEKLHKYLDSVTNEKGQILSEKQLKEQIGI